MATYAPLGKIDTLANRFVALATYRHLLRATRIAFNGTLSCPKPNPYLV
jgi:hypothetical protein